MSDDFTRWLHTPRPPIVEASICCERAHVDGDDFEHTRVFYAHGFTHPYQQMFRVIVERADGTKREYEGDRMTLATVRDLREFVGSKIGVDDRRLEVVNVRAQDELPYSIWIEFALQTV